MRLATPSAALVVLAAAACCALGPGRFGATAAAAEPGAPAPADAPSTQPVPPASPQDEALVRRLLGELSGEDWRQRQRAEDALVELGEVARPFLRRELPARAEDVEVRTRLESALKRIDADRLTGPSYVTLRLKDAAPAEAFSELSRQAFAPVTPYPDNLWERPGWPRVTLGVERKPFWVAALTLAAEANVGFQAFAGGLRVVDAPGQFSGPSDVRGPFLVVATHVARSQTIMLGNAPPPHQPQQPARPAVVRHRGDQFAVHLVVVPEPKLSVLRAAAAVKLEQAVDDHGNDLAPPRGNGGAGHTYSSGQPGVWNVYARLKYPPANAGRTIARLAGSASFAVQTRSERIEIAEPLKLAEAFRVIGGSRVTFHSMARRGDNYELKVSLTVDGVAGPRGGAGRGGGGGGGGLPTLSQSMQSHLRLLNTAGEPLERRGFSSQGDGRAMRFTVQFSRGTGGAGRDAPTRLVWDVPTETKDVEVPFEFKGLPMP